MSFTPWPERSAFHTDFASKPAWPKRGWSEPPLVHLVWSFLAPESQASSPLSA
jgi:hypothetical protein